MELTSNFPFNLSLFLSPLPLTRVLSAPKRFWQITDWCHPLSFSKWTKLILLNRNIAGALQYKIYKIQKYLLWAGNSTSATSIHTTMSATMDNATFHSDVDLTQNIKLLVRKFFYFNCVNLVKPVVLVVLLVSIVLCQLDTRRRNSVKEDREINSLEL